MGYVVDPFKRNEKVTDTVEIGGGSDFSEVKKDDGIRYHVRKGYEGVEIPKPLPKEVEKPKKPAANKQIFRIRTTKKKTKE